MALSDKEKQQLVAFLNFLEFEWDGRPRKSGRPFFFRMFQFTL